VASDALGHWQNQGVAETVSLAKARPRLEGVFGPLSVEDDHILRSTLSQADVELLALAEHFGRDGAGWQGTGLELVWYPSGRLAISSFVGAADDAGHAADFCAELHPSWFYGEASGEAAWNIESTIQVDCQHTLDHGGIEGVWDRGEVQRGTPTEAAKELLEAVRLLRRLGTEHPLDYWLAKAKDSQ
jgi:hypothetical protein